MEGWTEIHACVSNAEIIYSRRPPGKARSLVSQDQLDALNIKDRARLALALRGHLHELICCKFGNFVVSRVIQCLPYRAARWVSQEIAKEDVIEVAKSWCGYRVVRDLIRHHPSAPDTIEIIERLVDGATTVASHKEGKFSVIEILALADSEVDYPKMMRTALAGTWGRMAAMHHGVDVVSWGLYTRDPTDATEVILDELLATGGKGWADPPRDGDARCLKALEFYLGNERNRGRPGWTPLDPEDVLRKVNEWRARRQGPRGACDDMCSKVVGRRKQRHPRASVASVARAFCATPEAVRQP